MILEVIATTVEESIVAANHGADRIELISAMSEGGLTPSIGLIEHVTRNVDIPVYVMVRPHSNSFCYHEHDLSVMLRDIEQINRTGAAGIVVGALTEDQRIDQESMKRIIEAVDGLGITFHRAFDEVRDQGEAVQTLMKFPKIERILTSGGRSNAVQGKEQIKRLVDMTAGSSLSIMAGKGLNLQVLPSFMEETGAEELHFGSGVRCGELATHPMDPDKIAAASKLMRR